VITHVQACEGNGCRIAPVIAARLLGATVSIGGAATAAPIAHMGGTHRPAGPMHFCVDEARKIVTTPCYMYDSTPWQVFQGADRMVEAVLTLVRR
jgi:enhancing lycopene biosynthesis protein 2